MKFFLIDFYFLFLLILAVFSVMFTNFKKLYFSYKIIQFQPNNIFFKVTVNNILFLILKIGLIFILINIFFNISFNEIDSLFLNISYNIIVTSKIYLYIFAYFFVFLYEYYSFLFKWLSPEHLLLFFFQFSL